MDKILEKMARQINAYDEASLMALWDRYAGIVANFEPTKRWEEAALIFGIIQTVRWKNGLFNYHWAQSARSAEDDGPLLGPTLSLTAESGSGPLRGEAGKKSGSEGPGGGDDAKQGGKLLRFRPRKGDESV